MPEIRPFRAVRYDPGRAGRLEDVLAPPYDVIDPTLQDQLYERSPRNIVRLVLGRTFPGDGGASNRYTRAAALYRRWRETGILVADPEPALYLYAQRYAWRGGEHLTWGWVGAVRLEEPGKTFLPHEATLPGPKADRLALWQAARAEFSQVFGLYHRPDPSERELAQAVMGDAPLEQFTDDRGVEHRVWRVAGGLEPERLAADLRPLQVVLADGHHRFETAVALARGPLGTLPGAAWAALWLVNTALSPVTVLPTHRVLENGPGVPGWDDLLARARERFRVEPLAPAGAAEGAATGAAHPRISEPEEPGVVHLVGPDGSAWRLATPPDRSPELAVTMLHRELLDPILKGLAGSQAEGFERFLRFTHDGEEARRWVATGEGRAAFLLPALDGEAVRRAAETVGRLPQKSTYFYPKAPSGLLIYDLEESLGKL
ncbi:DUF1015 domain-containing protein [Limnochorda pilosa]|uniref:SpoOJ/ParA/ParB/repB family protein n=1 Tax=Limnochorda pilosa TaxID=1555112 RepID=A0A0K2SPA4_LIMPI|nr:DUF1015 domain-containing protein [Limnochorda pilosa]BAS28955.1 hypothetical protein LIP_3127 [Limnochorda pilosa]